MILEGQLINTESFGKSTISDSLNNKHDIDYRYSSELPLFHRIRLDLENDYRIVPAIENILVENNVIDSNIIGAMIGGAFSDCLFRKNIITNSSEGLDEIYDINIHLVSIGVTISNNLISNAFTGMAVQGRDNKISNNNFINLSYPSILFLILGDYPGILLNDWEENYYDDYLGFGPKIIPGFIEVQFQLKLLFLLPWFNVDWHPAGEPYEI